MMRSRLSISASLVAFVSIGLRPSERSRLRPRAPNACRRAAGPISACDVRRPTAVRLKARSAFDDAQAVPSKVEGRATRPCLLPCDALLDPLLLRPAAEDVFDEDAWRDDGIRI